MADARLEDRRILLKSAIEHGNVRDAKALITAIKKSADLSRESAEREIDEELRKTVPTCEPFYGTLDHPLRPSGETLLVLACSMPKAQPEIVRELLDARANPNDIRIKESTALDRATRGGHAEITALLLKANATIRSDYTYFNAQTPEVKSVLLPVMASRKVDLMLLSGKTT